MILPMKWPGTSSPHASETGRHSAFTLAELLVDVNGGGTYAMRSYPADRKRIDVGDYYADFQKIRGTLGWEPRVPLRDALTRTLTYYREHLEEYL